MSDTPRPISLDPARTAVVIMDLQQVLRHLPLPQIGRMTDVGTIVELLERS